MKSYKRVCLVSLAAAAVCFAAPNAFAAASKAMSGAACTGKVYFTPVQPPFYRVIDEQGFHNPRTEPADATCDLVRDNSTNETKPVDVYVRVTDNSNTSGFECFVWSCSHLGSNCRSYSFGTSNGFTGPESINVPVPQSYFNGYYTVTCSVPPDSTIHSLYVYEPD